MSWNHVLVLRWPLSLQILDLPLVIILKFSLGVCEVTAFTVLNYGCDMLIEVGIKDLCEHLVALGRRLRSLYTAITVLLQG